MVAAILRVSHVLALRDGPWFDHLVVDPDFYDRWAQRLASGDWLGDRPFYLDPFYPYFLGALYRVVGRDLLVVRLVQVGLSLASCALVYRIACAAGRGLLPSASWRDDQRARQIGLAAAAAFALYKPEIFFVAEIEKTTLSITTTAAFLACTLGALEAHRASRQRQALAAAAGTMLGLACLTRANLLVFAPLTALALVCLPAPQRRDTVAQGSARLRAASFLAGLALVLMPVAWRNHHVSGEWVLTTAQAGQNFYIGNNPANSYGAFISLPFVRANPDFEEIDFRSEAERRAGRPLTAREASSFWLGEGIAHVATNPGFAGLVTLRKVALFLNDFEISDNQDQYLLARDSWVMRLPLLGFGAVAPFALLGIVLCLRRSRMIQVLTSFVAIYAASVIAFFLFARYRIQMVPAMLGLAAVGGAELLTTWGTSSLRRRVGSLALLTGGAIFSFQTIAIFSPSHPVVIDMQLRKLAAQWETAGRPDLALQTYREALLGCPDGCPDLLADVLALAERSGRRDQARAILGELVAMRPARADARAALIHLDAATGIVSPGGGASAPENDDVGRSAVRAQAPPMIRLDRPRDQASRVRPPSVARRRVSAVARSPRHPVAAHRRPRRGCPRDTEARHVSR